MKEASAGLEGEAAKRCSAEVRKELGKPIHHVIDTVHYAQTEQAMEPLRSHGLGAKIAHTLNVRLYRILIHSLDYITRGSGVSRQSGTGEIPASGPVMAAIMAQSNDRSGRRCSARFITTSLPIKCGPNANEITVIAA